MIKTNVSKRELNTDFSYKKIEMELGITSPFLNALIDRYWDDLEDIKKTQKDFNEYLNSLEHNDDEVEEVEMYLVNPKGRNFNRNLYDPLNVDTLKVLIDKFNSKDFWATLSYNKAKNCIMLKDIDTNRKQELIKLNNINTMELYKETLWVCFIEDEQGFDGFKIDEHGIEY